MCYETLTYTQVEHTFYISNYVTSSRHVLSKNKNTLTGFSAEGTLSEGQEVKKPPKSYFKYLFKCIGVFYSTELLLP